MSNSATITDDPATGFERWRRPLARLAYRMLGSVADAEDVVQDAYLRWHDADRDSIHDPRAFLSTVVTRLCLDRWRRASRQRERYIGPWLPEPIVDEPPATDALADDVSVALMLALERLTPPERAAFLLHDVFGLSFGDIATALQRGEAACRQLARRARTHVQAQRRRFSVAAPEHERITDAFFAAAHRGDIDALRDLLAEDAVYRSDGGGRRPAARKPLAGAGRVARLLWGVARRNRWSGPRWAERLTINGLPGWLSVQPEGTLQTTALDIAGMRVTAIYVIRNPDKLRHLERRVPEAVRSVRGAQAPDAPAIAEGRGWR